MKIDIIGIDPSLRNFGFSKATLDILTGEVKVKDLILTETSGNKKMAKVVRKNSDDLERASLLHEAIIRECEGYTFAFVEVPVGSQSARAMASYGICIGVLAACPIPMIQVTPTEVKMASVGSKTATKEQMIEWATEQHPEAPWLRVKRAGKLQLVDKNEHLADATAAIYAGISTEEFMRAIALMRKVA